jgi:hypothetical protein
MAKKSVKKSKTHSAKRRVVAKPKTAQDMVRSENVIVLKKKPEPEELPPVAIDIVQILEAKGGELPESELLPMLTEKVGVEEHAQTAWSYWRSVLEGMGILSVKK